MDRLIEHIERLLLRHDCVIIPDFGGFVLQSVSAMYVDNEHSFTPSRKEIVFNPTLTHNDGLLIEAYMQANSIDFSKAQQLVRKDVAGMKEYIEDYSELQIGEVGLFMKDDKRLIFMPGKNSDNMFSVSSYGLPVFHYLPLSLRTPLVLSKDSASAASDDSPKKTAVKRGGNVIYNIPVTRTFLRAVATTAAAILLFLFISTPVSDVNNASYSASFVPHEIMPKRTSDDVVSNIFSGLSDKVEYVSEPDFTSGAATDNKFELEEAKAAVELDAIAKVRTTAKPEVNPDVKASSTKSATNTKSSTAKSAATATSGVKYYVIIASFENRTQAQSYIKRLKGAESGTAGVVSGDGRVRVYAQHFTTEKAAQSHMNKIRQNPKHKQAWVYKAKN